MYVYIYVYMYLMGPKTIKIKFNINIVDKQIDRQKAIYIEKDKSREKKNIRKIYLCIDINTGIKYRKIDSIR